jgi:hypothetical protein
MCLRVSCRTPSFTQNFGTRCFSHKFVSLTHHLSHNFVTHTHTRHHLSLSHTSFHIQLCHTQFCFTSRSSTTSFVFPSFPIPATTFGAYYWRKLSCGVIRSLNFLLKSTNSLFKPGSPVGGIPGPTFGWCFALTPRLSRDVREEISNSVKWTHGFIAQNAYLTSIFLVYNCLYPHS